jgi:DNA-binding winged helix-turn-helix (wHTH) protein
MEGLSVIYRFGDYELDTDLYELRHTGKALRVEPKVFDLLAYLVQHHGHVCSKERLLEQLWADQYVSDWALAYSIKAARHVVGDRGPVKHVIQTVRGRGY